MSTLTVKIIEMPSGKEIDIEDLTQTGAESLCDDVNALYNKLLAIAGYGG